MDVHPPKYSKIGFDTSPFDPNGLTQAHQGLIDTLHRPRPRNAGFSHGTSLVDRCWIALETYKDGDRSTSGIHIHIYIHIYVYIYTYIYSILQYTYDLMLEQ